MSMGSMDAFVCVLRYTMHVLTPRKCNSKQVLLGAELTLDHSAPKILGAEWSMIWAELSRGRIVLGRVDQLPSMHIVRGRCYGIHIPDLLDLGYEHLF